MGSVHVFVQLKLLVNARACIAFGGYLTRKPNPKYRGNKLSPSLFPCFAACRYLKASLPIFSIISLSTISYQPPSLGHCLVQIVVCPTPYLPVIPAPSVAVVRLYSSFRTALSLLPLYRYIATWRPLSASMHRCGRREVATSGAMKITVLVLSCNVMQHQRTMIPAGAKGNSFDAGRTYCPCLSPPVFRVCRCLPHRR